MFPSAYLLLLLAQPGEIQVTSTPTTLELAWSDVEDRIQGSISPKNPVEQVPLVVTAHVGSFQGEEFDGPVTFSLKPVDARAGGQSKTVKRAKGEKAWRVELTPDGPGMHSLDLSWSTTRLKVASAKIPVQEAKLPRWPWWVMVGLAAVTALGLGVRSMFKKQETT